MPTLREIEQGLRERVAELSRVRDEEAAQRDRARAKVEEVATRAGNDNSIGESLDELLVELGLHGRPIRSNVHVHVEHRQRIVNHTVRDLRVGGSAMWAAYQNLSQPAWLHTTSLLLISQSVPRDHDGCACSLPITPEQIRSILGSAPEGVEQVDVQVLKCGFADYPHTNDSERPSACLTLRATREREKAEAHDDPLVQQCTFGHGHLQPHRHLFYTNGEVSYTMREDWTSDATAMVVPGWYGSGVQVGQPIPGTPEPDAPRVQQCEVEQHPSYERHKHVLFPPNDVPAYTPNMAYAVSGSEVLVDGVFSRDADVVGTLLT